MGPFPKLVPRERFILAAAKLYGLHDGAFSVGGVRKARVNKEFFMAMQSCPMPPYDSNDYRRADYWEMTVTRSHCFPHLASCRLQGVKLPFPIKYFAPTQ
jgi:hypothetical protein